MQIWACVMNCKGGNWPSAGRGVDTSSSSSSSSWARVSATWTTYTQHTHTHTHICTGKLCRTIPAGQMSWPSVSWISRQDEIDSLKTEHSNTACTECIICVGMSCIYCMLISTHTFPHVFKTSQTLAQTGSCSNSIWTILTAPPYLLYLAIMHALMLDDVLTSVNGRFDVVVSGILWDPLAQRLCQ